MKHFGRKMAAASVVVVAVVTAGTAAFADAVDTGFTNMGTTLVGYLGDAVALVLLVIGLGLGIRMLIKWTKRAVSAT